MIKISKVNYKDKHDVNFHQNGSEADKSLFSTPNSHLSDNIHSDSFHNAMLKEVKKIEAFYKKKKSQIENHLSYLERNSSHHRSISKHNNNTDNKFNNSNGRYNIYTYISIYIDTHTYNYIISVYS